jgi:hypothetical protein
MKDRVVQYPNRYKLTPVSGDVYDLTPEPGIVTEEGAPLNKANLLSDETAAKMGLTGDPTPNDVFYKLKDAVLIAGYVFNEVFRASTMPSSANWFSVAYGDGKFVAVAITTDKAAYSINGINWTAATMPSSANWRSVTYGDGKFVAVANSDKAAYSTNGINWIAATLPSSADWQSVTYGDGKFVAVTNTDKAPYSTDGINWTAATMPSSASWRSVTYGDGKFVVVAVNTDKAAYSVNLAILTDIHGNVLELE